MIISLDLLCYLVKALCSNCGSEVEITDTDATTGSESYKCAKCGTIGTISRDGNNPSISGVHSSKMSVIPGISIDLNVLGLGLSTNNVKCPMCGNYFSSEHARCPFCMQQLK
jgi:predicted RNA-binding Zn-ribbon protein involved in translation (DUF1610 family)